MSTPHATTIQDPELPLLSEAPPDPQTEVQRAVQANLQNEIDSVVRLIANPQLREVSETILVELVRFFDWLARIENNLHKLDTLLENLSLLEVLEFESRSLIDYIETKASKVASAGGHDRLNDVLDGISY